MQKSEIHQLFVTQLTRELDALTAAARDSFATATDEAHQAESKYDTFSLESSYLARGQAKRVKELADARERMEALPQKVLDERSPIQLGALVRLHATDGEKRCVYFGPAGGGEQITVEGEEIIIVTSQSPLGKAILGQKVGHTFDIKMGFDAQTFNIVSVE